ncbi:MATE family efflux transporter [Enterococcus pseudoavium]|uniref:MATE family efflux transporter n=1 Tax=Enterococcus pseudoavium TaxID=44007 RepID=A0ABU3FH24_9ENTE|nr:MATE family efflux transporter [Enterococcus pseudoavium]MDT2754630.1 MATE family efflux transporter [Enterococcus pseudoavium]MDT2769314.1 MATE family efflux transporter [Enterococcus pseudoavium]
MKNYFATKTFRQLLIPTMMTNLVTAVGSFSVAMIVGNLLDERALSAVTLANPAFMIINTIAAIFAVGGVTCLTQAKGRGETKTSNQLFSMAILSLLFLSFVGIIFGLFFLDSLVYLLGTREAAVKTLVTVYLRVILLGLPCFFLNTTLAFFVRTDGNPNLSMAGMLTAIVLEIILDVLFVQHFGVAGAALGLVVAQFVSLGIISSHFLQQKNTLHWHKPEFKLIFQIVQNGVGTSLSFIYQFLLLITFNNLIARFAGNDGIVAFSVVVNLTAIAMSLYEGISQTVQPIISVYYGEKYFQAVRLILKHAFQVGAVLCVLVTVILEWQPDLISRMFHVTSQPALADSILGTQIFAPAIIVMSFNALMSYFYQTTERRLLAGAIVLLRGFLLPVLFGFLLGYQLGLTGIWLAYPCAELATSVFILVATGLIKRKEQLADRTLLPEAPLEYYFAGKSDQLDKPAFLQTLPEEAEFPAIFGQKLAALLVKQPDAQLELRIYHDEDWLAILRTDQSLENQKEVPLITDWQIEQQPILGINRLLVRREVPR